MPLLLVLALPSPPCSAIPAEALQTDYEWVREYDQSIKFDAKDQTYLFR